MATNDMLVGGNADDAWEKRWSALQAAIDKMFNEYGTVPATPRLKTLRPLLLCLKAFGEKRFKDFHDGFIAQRLETWPDFPPDAVLSSVQDQIGFDIAAIDRAILQRISGTSLMKDSLEIADRLAWSALQLAVGAGILPAGKMTAVTYFQKSPDIRVIPYAPVALIGIPYSAQQLERDMLATPHEVGHYVFGHAKYNGRPLRKYLVEQLELIVTNRSEYDRLLRWLEEIFADVYGACVAGPAVALDFQDLQLHTGRQRFITDDKDHPTPILRPNLHLQVLRKRNPAEWGAWADVLERNWQVRLKERERIDHLDAQDAIDRARRLNHIVSDNQAVAVASIVSDSSSAAQDVKPLDQLVTVMLDVLKSGSTHPWYNALSAAPTAGVESLDLNTLVSTTEKLYDAFCDFVRRPPVVDADKIDPLLNMPINTDDDLKAVVSQWLDAKHLEFPQEPKVEHTKWKPYFDADGWTTEGPQLSWP
jgi:hypothetical protein